MATREGTAGSMREGGFRLKPNSPALKLGFKPIPVERIGLYPDEYR